MSDSKKPSKLSSSNLRIAFDGTPLFRKIDGVGRYTQNLIGTFAEQNPAYDIRIVGFMDDTLYSKDLLTKHSNITLLRLPFPRRLYQALYSKLARLPVDAFLPKLDAYVGTNFVNFPFITKAPTLIAIHDLAYLEHPEVIEKKNLRYLTKHVPKTVQESSVLLATSTYTASQLEAHFQPTRRPVVVSNALDPLFLQDAPKSRKDYILAVGTIEPRKNLSTLIEAYTSLPASLKHSHPLRIVGNGGWGDITLEPNDTTITLTGYVSDKDLVTLYREARLFVFPSIYEGFGLPLLEAMASETPIACSRIVPFAEIAKGTATYFDPHSAKEIAHTLESLLSLPATSNPEAAKIARSYTWQESSAQLSLALSAVVK